VEREVRCHLSERSDASDSFTERMGIKYVY